MNNDKDLIKEECHPFAPFIPEGAKVLIMGTFPPPEHRHCMHFYYPNPQNDMWRIMGLIFFNSPDEFYFRDKRQFNEQAIREFMTSKGIAFSDTGARVRRLAGNASDKYLDIVEPVDLIGLLAQMPNCRAVATTGMKAAEVIASLTSTPVPSMGECVRVSPWPAIWRMPSTSRAYPLKLDKKVEFYRRMLKESGVEMEP